MVTSSSVIHSIVLFVGVLKNVQAQTNCDRLGQDGCPPTWVIPDVNGWGKIRSPGYPDTYPADHYVWKISCNTKLATRLVFDDFDLEPADSIQVYHGLQKLKTFLGSSGERPVFEDSHSNLSLILRISPIYHSTRRGFALTFRCEADSVWESRPVTSQLHYTGLSARYSRILTIPSTPETSNVDTVIVLGVPKRYDAIYLHILQDTYLRGVENGWGKNNFFEVHQGDSVSHPLINTLTFAYPRDLDTSTVLPPVYQSVLTLRVRGRFERGRKLSLLVTALAVKDCGMFTDQFKCNRAVMCIAKTLVSNGYRNCPDGSDEECSGFLCHDRSECLASHRVCDGSWHCRDGSDEKQCPAVSTTMPPKKTDGADSTPTVLFIGALGIIGCLLFAIILVLIRRRVIRCDKICNHRESRRARRRTGTHLSVTVNNIASSVQGLPPTYEEAVHYNHVTGNINFAFSSDDPPAYETIGEIVVPPVGESPPEYSTLDRRGMVLSAVALYNTNPLNERSSSVSSSLASDSMTRCSHNTSSSPPGLGIHGTDDLLANMNLVRNSSSQTRSVESENPASDSSARDLSSTVNEALECSEVTDDTRRSDSITQFDIESSQVSTRDDDDDDDDDDEDDGMVVILASSHECQV